MKSIHFMKSIVALFVLFSCALITACSSQHIIATTDGRLIQTDSTPRLNEKTGMYTFEDEEGRETQIRKDEVKQIIER